MNKDILESILNMIENLEDLLSEIKVNITEFKDLEDDDQRSSYDFSFQKVMDATHEFRSLKKAIKMVFRRFGGGHGYSDSNDVGFSFDFGLENLGESIERTVKSALSGLENLEGIFDSDFGSHFKSRSRHREQRHKVVPGVGISYGSGELYNEPEMFPDISEIKNGKQILEILEKGILSDADVASDLQLTKDDIIDSLALLKEKGFVLQEKAGKQRYMLTRRGKKFLTLNNQEGKNNNN